MFSNVAPYKLTQEQENELYSLYDQLAEQAFNKQGISKDDDNYYDVFYDEYVKIDSSYEEINQFYIKYNLNKYTSFEGFTNVELENAWKLLEVDPNNIGTSSRSNSGGILQTTFTGDSRLSYQLEVGENNKFKGLFLQTQTYSDKNILNDYEVDFAFFYNYFENNSNSNIENSIISSTSNTLVQSQNTIKKENSLINYLDNKKNYVSKLPQTGDFFNEQDALFFLIFISAVGIVFLLIINTKYKNIDKK